MTKNRTIVFLSHNIYTEGVVNRLRQYPQSGEIVFVDCQEDHYIDKVKSLNPEIVILDREKAQEDDCCLMCELFDELPSVTIIRLQVEKKDVQVISNSTHLLKGVSDLIDLINGKSE